MKILNHSASFGCWFFIRSTIGMDSILTASTINDSQASLTSLDYGGSYGGSIMGMSGIIGYRHGSTNSGKFCCRSYGIVLRACIATPRPAVLT